MGKSTEDQLLEIAKQYGVDDLDVSAAYREGVPAQEIANELYFRQLRNTNERAGTGLDVEAAYRDGISLEDIGGELNRRISESNLKNKQSDIKSRLHRAEALREQARNIETRSTDGGFLPGLDAFARDALAVGINAGAGILDAAGGIQGLVSVGDMDNALRRGAKSLQEFSDKSVASPEMRKQKQAIDWDVEEAGSDPDDGAVMQILKQAGARMGGIATNPLAAADFIGTQAAQLVIPMGIARGAGAIAARTTIAARAAAIATKAAQAQGLTAEAVTAAAQKAGAQALSTFATRASVGAGASVQGGSVGGGTYDDLMALPDENWESLPEYGELLADEKAPEEAKQAIAEKYALMAGGVGALSSLLFNRGDLAQTTERVIAGAAGKSAQKSLRGRAIEAVKKTAAESLWSEPGEEVSGQGAQNLAVGVVDPNRKMTEGLGDALGGAVLGGASMGGLSGVGEAFIGGSSPGAPPSASGIEKVGQTKQVEQIDTSSLERVDETAKRNLEVQAKRNDADFAEAVKARPELAPTVDAWRKQNPRGDFDSFIQHVQSEESSQKAQEAAASPQVQEAVQGHEQAVAKLESAQAVATADPAQAPPAGITPEEARDIAKNGTGNLEKEAKAAEEHVRTVRQTVEKESDAGSVTDGLAETVKAARDGAKKDAGQLLKETQAAMLEGATEFDGEKLAALAEESGMTPEAAEQRVAAVDKRVKAKKEKEKAAKNKERGVQGEQGRQTPAKAPSAPAATPPIQSDAEEILRTFQAEGREAANARYVQISNDKGLNAGESAALAGAFHKLAQERGVNTKKGATREQATPEQGEAGAPERSGSPAVAGEPGGQLPQDAGRVPQGGEPGAEPRVDGEAGGASLRGDERGPGAGNRDAGSDGRSGEGVPSRELGKPVGHSSTPMSPGGNFNATEEDVGPAGAGTVKQFEQNLAALRLLKELETQGRQATPEEKRVLGKWNGWGPIAKWLYPDGKGYTDADRARFAQIAELVTEEELKGLRQSTLNAHYTSPEVVDSMWDAIRSLGFKGGNVVDPSMGSGIFFGRMPRDLMDSSKLRGVELERVTAGIAKHLYEQAEITQGGYQDQRIPVGSVDLHISNVPFGNMVLNDRETGWRGNIHNFFFQKAVRETRPGGLIVFITGKGTMDAVAEGAGGVEFRKALQKDARFLGAVRLPNNAFLGSANTKVITDVIVLQKRADGDSSTEIDWFDRGTIAGKSLDGAPAEFEINRYYQENPDNVLGEVRPGSLYRKAEGAADTDVVSTGRDVPKEIRERLGKLEGVNRDALATGRTREMVDSSVKAAKNLPPKSLMVKDGKWFKTDDIGGARPVEIDEKAAKALEDVLPIRDAVRNLVAAQLEGGDTAAAREALNGAYDSFAKGGKTLHGIRRFVELDEANAPSLLALEEKKDGKFQKAEIFTKNTQKTAERSQEAKTADDALLLSLDEKGGVDMAFMVERSGMTEEQLLAGLPGKLFIDPQTGGYVVAETYLAGDVAAKLAVARSAGDRFTANVQALEGALPPEVAPEEVRVRLGAGWVPAGMVNQFLQETGTGTRVKFNEATGQWSIQRGQDSGFEFQSDGVSSEFLLNCAFNFAPATVTIRTPDGTEIVHQERSAVARIMYERMQRRFAEWMVETNDRAEFVRKAFNEKLGGMAVPQFDGSHLSLPGMTQFWRDRLRPHQRAAVWRILNWGSTILHHDVGTGKTATMTAALMELRRTGKANKPMVVVPNHIVDQFGKEALQMYPGAKVLVLGKAELEKSKRRVTMAKIATGDWDLVVVPHSSFTLLPMSRAKIEAYAQEEIDALTSALEAAARDRSLDGRQRKQLEKRIASIEERIKKQIASLEGDPGPFFDELGVDALAVDEAHEFKNLANITKAGRIKGVSVSDAEKSLDLFMKVKHLTAVTGGRNIIFATGTPITRTIVETHTYMRYLAPGILKRLGCQSLDQFLHQFGAVSSEAALAPGGGKLRVEQHMKWQNVPQLSAAWQQISDRVSATKTAIVRPPIKGGKPTTVTVPRHPLIGEIMNEISLNIQRLAKGGRNEKGAPNILSEMMRARKLALDWRLLDPNAPDLPGSKVNECVRSVLEIYQAEEEVKGTQIIWCDLGVPTDRKAAKKVVDEESEVDDDGEESGPFNLYQDIKDKLVAGGIPADEIQFIHDHRTDKHKAALFPKINRGEVRVILASSKLMATGANIQERLAGMHHLDATWNPSDMEQRNGRGIRQGNIYSGRGGVDIRYYSTEKTFDAFFWQNLERKAKVIEAFFSGNLKDREMEDAGMGAITAAQAKAEASGDPEMFEYVSLQRRVEELEQAKAEVEKVARRARATLPSQRDALETAKAKLDLIPEGSFKLEDVKVNGQEFATTGDLAANIRERWLLHDRNMPFYVFTVGGSRLMMKSGSMQLQAPWSVSLNAMEYAWEKLDGNGVNWILRNVSPLTAKEHFESNARYYAGEIQASEKKAAQTFEEQEELDRIMPRFTELSARLMGDTSNGSSSIEQGGIEQPDDGTILSDMGNVDIKGVRKSVIQRGLGTQARVQEYGLESVDRRSNVPVAQVFDSWEESAPIGSASIDGNKYVLFRSKGEVKAISLPVYLQMAQKGAGFSVDPGFQNIVSKGPEGYQVVRLIENTQLADYGRRLLRMPTEPQIPKGMEALADLTPERIADAGKKLSGKFFREYETEQRVKNAQEALREALLDIDTAQELTRELEGSIALLSGGTLDQKTAAAVYRKIVKRTKGQGERVHKALGGIAKGLELVATAEVFDKITAAGKRFSLEGGYGSYWMTDVLSAVNDAYGTEVNRYNHKETAELLVGYAADLFTQATGKELNQKTEGEFREWMAGEVTLNANRFPALMVAGAGILGASMVSPGAGQYLAAGLVAWGMMNLAKKIWSKATFIHSPRTQIAGIVSRNARGVNGFRILEMLDQAFLRASEISGTPSMIVKRMRRASGNKDVGKLLSDFVENGKIQEEYKGLGLNAKAVLDYFRKKMDEAGIPSLDGYLPRVYLHEGIGKALKDPKARAELIADVAAKIEEFHPEWIQKRIDGSVSWELSEGNEERREEVRKAAAEDAAVELLEQLEENAMDDSFSTKERNVNVTVFESRHTKGRKLLFEIPRTITDSKGNEIELVERDFYKIMDSYIPSMSRTLAEKETVNASDINAWLRGIQGDEKSRDKVRMLKYIRNDLSGSTERFFGKKATKFFRGMRMVNSVRYLGLSIWYPVRNFLFGSPLSLGLTDFPSAAVGLWKGSLAMPLIVAESLAARPWVKWWAKYGIGKAASLLSWTGQVSTARVEMAGAMTQSIFDDTMGRKGDIARAIMAPSLLTQNGVDVMGFYAGRHYARTLAKKAGKSAEARGLLEESLGTARASAVMKGEELTEADLDRVGLFYKNLISGTSRGLNLPPFMGNDIGRTVFQFGSIPMEQTRTLSTRILPDPLRSAQYATGATLAGLVMFLRLLAAVNDPEDEKEEKKRRWIEESPGWQKFAFIMAQSGAPQMFGPGFEYLSGMGRANMSVSELLPMPTVSGVTGLMEATGAGFLAAGKAAGKDASLTEMANVAAMPMARELVNNASSLPRSFGIRLGKSETEMDLAGP